MAYNPFLSLWNKVNQRILRKCNYCEITRKGQGSVDKKMSVPPQLLSLGGLVITLNLAEVITSVIFSRQHLVKRPCYFTTRLDSAIIFYHGLNKGNDGTFYEKGVYFSMSIPFIIPPWMQKIANVKLGPLRITKQPCSRFRNRSDQFEFVVIIGFNYNN